MADTAQKWDSPTWLRRWALVESIVCGVALCLAVGFAIVDAGSSAILMGLVAIVSGSFSYVFARRSRELSASGPKG